MKNSIKLGLTASFLAFFISCVRQPEQPGPCAGIPESSGEFVMKGYYGYKNKYTKELEELGQDTFTTFSTMVLAAKDTEADKYEWQVGLDTTKYDRKAESFSFFSKDSNKTRKVTLKVTHRKPTYTCYPDDDSIKTSEKIFSTIPNEDAFYFGKWYGHYTNKPDSSFEIDVKKILDVARNQKMLVGVENFPAGCKYFYPECTSAECPDNPPNKSNSYKFSNANTYQFTGSYIREKKYFGKTTPYDCFGYENDEIVFQVHKNRDSLTVFIERSKANQKFEFKAKRIKNEN